MRHEELSIGVLTSDTILLQGDTLTPGGVVAAGRKYYVSRNKSGSGDGSSWDKAFLTLTEAVAVVNAGYTAGAYDSNKGRNTVIYVDEGWYAESPIMLTANDCTIVSVAPGHHYNTILYCSAGGGPALIVAGWNCSVLNMGFYVADTAYAAVQNGLHNSHASYSSYTISPGNAYKNCSFVRDGADASAGGILSYGADYTLIDRCSFSTSQKDYGVSIQSNGEINPVNHTIIDCDFVGTPIGVIIGAGHNTKIQHNMFRDDSSDRPDTITTPVTNAGSATSTVCIENYWAFSDANAVTGNQAMMINNFQLATT